MSRSRRMLPAGIFALWCTGVCCDCAHANTITVYKAGDNGAGTLRQAILDASSGDTINFSITGIVTLTSGELLIGKSLTISGPGARRLIIMRSTVAGTPSFGIFTVTTGTVTISGLTVANGLGAVAVGTYAGGLTNRNGVVLVDRCTFTGNRATGNAGGIYNASTMSVSNTTVSNNTGSSGGIDNDGTLFISNSTVSGNVAGSIGSGGGGGVSTSGLLEVFSCTIAGNDATAGFFGSGGGIWAIPGPNNIVRIGNSIVSGNASDPANPDVSGTFVSLGYNLIRIGAGGSGFGATGDQVGTSGSPINANLGPLQDNGGPTDTRLPQGASPAKDQGFHFSHLTEQRGLPRTYDNPAIPNAVGGDGSDIGAIEVHPPRALLVTNLNDAGSGSLRQAVEDATGLDTIIFATGLAGGIMLNSGTLLVQKDLIVTGPGAAVIGIGHDTATGTRDFPSFTMQPIQGRSITVTLSNLSFFEGKAVDGGALFNDQESALTVDDCNFQGNATRPASGNGGSGGAIANLGELNLNTCRFLRNNAVSAGGALLNAGTAVVRRCTFEENHSNLKGGGVANSVGSLSMYDCTFTGNSAPSGGGLQRSAGLVNVIASTFSANNAADAGGGLDSSGSTSVSNCTFAGNIARIGAGVSCFTVGDLNIISCTIADNNGNSASSSDGGGGVAAYGGATTGAVRITNSIVAGNTHNQGGPDASGTFISDGFNLIGKRSGSTGFTDGVNHDIVGTVANPVNPILGPLEDNGGYTLTRAPLPGSPAIDAGKTIFMTDQRGSPRQFNDPNALSAIGSDSSDIGSVEKQPGPPQFVSITRAGNTATVRYKGEADVFYQLQSSDNLQTFNDVGAPVRAGVLGNIIFTDNGPLLQKRFYRAYRAP